MPIQKIKSARILTGFLCYNLIFFKPSKCSIMKILTALFFLSSFFTSVNTTESAPLQRKGPVNVSVTAETSDLCQQTATWHVYVCNDSPTNTASTTVQITLEYCPFTFDFVTEFVSNLAPQTCTVLSGTIANPCQCLYITAEAAPGGNLSPNATAYGGGCC